MGDFLFHLHNFIHYCRLILLLNITYTAACFGQTTIFEQKYIISEDY
jgi:hypothetical protein